MNQFEQPAPLGDFSAEPYVPTKEEFDRLKQYVLKHGGKLAKRDYMITLLTWGRGLRPNEVLRLQLSQIFNDVIYIPCHKSKTGLSVDYVISQELSAEIHRYITERSNTINSPQHYLFPSRRFDSPLSVGNWSSYFKEKYLNKCFQQKVRLISKNGRNFVKYSPYCGRRYFFSWMDDVLGDKYSISDKCLLTGHKNPMTLHMFYLRKNQKSKAHEMMRELMAAASPRTRELPLIGILHTVADRGGTEPKVRGGVYPPPTERKHTRKRCAESEVGFRTASVAAKTEGQESGRSWQRPNGSKAKCYLANHRR